jgi:hypothetical protein
MAPDRIAENRFRQVTKIVSVLLADKGMLSAVPAIKKLPMFPHQLKAAPLCAHNPDFFRSCRDIGWRNKGVRRNFARIGGLIEHPCKARSLA